MRKLNRFALATFLLLALAMPTIAATPTPRPPQNDPDQPHMQAALDALKQAEMHLKEAKSDKGGHRVAAIKATEEAIKHVEAGMKVGEKNEKH
jgi:hypothetical protein